MLISIITINYNNKEGLERTIKSVVSQTFKDFEYVVIDGNSTDGSKELIEKNEAHIGYWISEKDSGIYNAMNKGIKASKGKYLLFLNSGDVLSNERVLQDVSDELNTDEDIYYGDLELIHGTERETKVYPDKLSLIIFLIKVIFLIHPPL